MLMKCRLKHREVACLNDKLIVTYSNVEVSLCRLLNSSCEFASCLALPERRWWCFLTHLKKVVNNFFIFCIHNQKSFIFSSVFIAEDRKINEKIMSKQRKLSKDKEIQDYLEILVGKTDFYRTFISKTH